MFAVYLIVFFLGVFLVLVTMFSAIRTVVVPRGERVVLTRIMFSFVRWGFLMAASYMKDYKARDTVLARYAPTTLILLPVLWASGVLLGFAAMFWSIGARPISHTFELSGSSITTLGFHATDNHWELALAVPEGLIGIGLVALLISYLPSIYNLFRERETMCTGWNIRAGSPPTVAVVVKRFNEVGILENMEETWREWENWFVSNEEVTLSYPALAFFRSPTPHQSWVTTAGNVLDTAAFIETAVKVPHSPSSHLCLQAGYVALRRIAENYDADFDQDPSPDDPISIPRHEFDEVCDQLAAEGVPIEEDRDMAWREFSGWRVNYDVPLRMLCQIVLAPYAQWSSDYVESVHGRRQFPFNVRKLFASQWWYRISRRGNSDEEADEEKSGEEGEQKKERWRKKPRVSDWNSGWKK